MTAATPRRPMSAKRRQHIFSEACTGHNVAPCCICGKPIHRHNDDWIVEHVRALGLLGKDANTNCGPAHVECAKVKTFTEDLPRIAKAKRMAVAALPRTGGFSPPVANTPKLGMKRNPSLGGVNSTPHKTKKPARGFHVPAGVKFDWKKGRYVRSATEA